MSVSASAAALNSGYVVGVKTGSIYPRLDIDEFAADNDVLNLFLQALIQLQADVSHNQPWSWYQISGTFLRVEFCTRYWVVTNILSLSGIHGRPFADWDNVGLKSKRGGTNPLAGYCSHSNVTFPTWHRPYIAMMEVCMPISINLEQLADWNGFLASCLRCNGQYCKTIYGSRNSAEVSQRMRKISVSLLGPLHTEENLNTVSIWYSSYREPS